MPAPTLSVILCNYNDAPYLEAAVTTIVSAPQPPDQIVVVDDGSSDDSATRDFGYAPRKFLNGGMADLFGSALRA